MGLQPEKTRVNSGVEYLKILLSAFSVGKH